MGKKTHRTILCTKVNLVGFFLITKLKCEDGKHQEEEEEEEVEEARRTRKNPLRYYWC
jgi:hypothetical protein